MSKRNDATKLIETLQDDTVDCRKAIDEYKMRIILNERAIDIFNQYIRDENVTTIDLKSELADGIRRAIAITPLDGDIVWMDDTISITTNFEHSVIIWSDSGAYRGRVPYCEMKRRYKSGECTPIGNIFGRR